MAEVRSVCEMIIDFHHQLVVIFGPLATKWFNFLQRRVCFPKRPALEVGARVFADQVLITPCSIALFLSTMSILQGLNPRDRLESTWWPALCKNWMVWPLVQTVNFALVPLQYRVLVVNVAALGMCSHLLWECFLLKIIHSVEQLSQLDEQYTTKYNSHLKFLGCR